MEKKSKKYTYVVSSETLEKKRQVALANLKNVKNRTGRPRLGANCPLMIYIEKDTMEALKTLTASTGKSKAQVIREILVNYFKKSIA